MRRIQKVFWRACLFTGFFLSASMGLMITGMVTGCERTMDNLIDADDLDFMLQVMDGTNMLRNQDNLLIVDDRASNVQEDTWSLHVRANRWAYVTASLHQEGGDGAASMHVFEGLLSNASSQIDPKIAAMDLRFPLQEDAINTISIVSKIGDFGETKTYHVLYNFFIGPTHSRETNISLNGRVTFSFGEENLRLTGYEVTRADGNVVTRYLDEMVSPQEAIFDLSALDKPLEDNEHLSQLHFTYRGRQLHVPMDLTYVVMEPVSPVWRTHMETVLLCEDTSLGNHIAEIPRATSVDGSPIAYRLKEGSDHNETFAFNETTRALTKDSNEFNYTNQATYTVVIVATDASRSNEYTLTIQLIPMSYTYWVAHGKKTSITKSSGSNRLCIAGSLFTFDNLPVLFHDNGIVNSGGLGAHSTWTNGTHGTFTFHQGTTVSFYDSGIVKEGTLSLHKTWTHSVHGDFIFRNAAIQFHGNGMIKKATIHTAKSLTLGTVPTDYSFSAGGTISFDSDGNFIQGYGTGGTYSPDASFIKFYSDGTAVTNGSTFDDNWIGNIPPTPTS